MQSRWGKQFVPGEYFLLTKCLFPLKIGRVIKQEDAFTILGSCNFHKSDLVEGQVVIVKGGRVKDVVGVIYSNDRFIWCTIDISQLPSD